MKYLLDTCVVSEPTKRIPNERVMQWLGSVPIADTWLSSVTIGEVQKGVYILDESNPVRRRLEDWLVKVQEEYAGRILAFDETTALVWGRLVGMSSRKGQPKPFADSQIAATALRHGMTLVTRNVRDMADFGVEIFNPFGD